MADYTHCPHCGHSFSKSILSNYASMYRCKSCQTVFCYQCNRGSDSSPKGPKCGERNADRDGRLMGR